MSTMCKMCGAANPTKARGGPARKFCGSLCKSRYHAGYTGAASVPWQTRFWAQVERSEHGSCWPYSIKRARSGYGLFMLDGRNKLAHRVSYELSIGPIPDGLIVMHVCDRPACVNPSHLRLGTYADNSRDMREKGRAARGDQISTTKLSDAQVTEIVGRVRVGESTSQLARQFGISRGYVNDLAAGRSNRAILAAGY